MRPPSSDGTAAASKMLPLDDWEVTNWHKEFEKRYGAAIKELQEVVNLAFSSLTSDESWCVFDLTFALTCFRCAVRMYTLTFASRAHFAVDCRYSIWESALGTVNNETEARVLMDMQCAAVMAALVKLKDIRVHVRLEQAFAEGKSRAKTATLDYVFSPSPETQVQFGGYLEAKGPSSILDDPKSTSNRKVLGQLAAGMDGLRQDDSPRYALCARALHTFAQSPSARVPPLTAYHVALTSEALRVFLVIRVASCVLHAQHSSIWCRVRQREDAVCILDEGAQHTPHQTRDSD